MTSQFKSEFESLRDDFVKFAFSSLENGPVREKMSRTELIKLLSTSFSGLAYLVRFARKLRVSEDEDFNFALENSQLRINDIEPNMNSITIYGRIKEIYSKFKFERDDGNEGQGASFLLHDPTGDIRVILWGKHSKILKKNEFNVNELVKILNGYAKKSRAGTEIHVGKYGSVILSPERVDLTDHPELIDSKNSAKAKEIVAQRIRSIGIKDAKVKRIICPHCSSMCPANLKFCRICGEPLKK